MKWPSIFSSLVVLTLSGILWWQGTDGFRAFTSETARRMDVLERPFQLPNVAFTNQDNKSVRLEDYQGKIILADFIYTSCADVCHSLGFAFKSLQKKLKQRGLLKHVSIISISFDPEYDHPQQLKAYLKRYTKDTQSWQALRLENSDALQTLLNDFGVFVIKREQGGYEHNAAIHIIDEYGKLSGIYDYQSVDYVINQIQSKVDKKLAYALAYEN